MATRVKCGPEPSKENQSRKGEFHERKDSNGRDNGLEKYVDEVEVLYSRFKLGLINSAKSRASEGCGFPLRGDRNRT